MSRYHSVCETCGFEDPNDGSIEEDCGHPFFSIIDHYEHHPFKTLTPYKDDQDGDEE